MKRRIHMPGIALLATATLVLASCATAGTGGNDNQTSPDEVSDEITEEDVTLRLAYTDDPPTEALVEGFVAEHPNVTIETEQTAFSDYMTSITRSMSSDDAPDMAQYNPAAMRSLIPSNDVLELDRYAELYGWDETFPQASLEPLMSDENAQQFGTGSLYAAPGALSVLGIYYNKAMLEEAGVDSLPGTLKEFTGAMEAVAENGDDPLSLGALQVGGTHLWNTVLNSVGNTDNYVDWVYGAPNSTIETDGAREATETITDWAEAGYISEAANATSDADALANFTAGEAAFHVTGNWAAAAVEDEMGDEAGFFVLPGTDPDAAPVASGSSVAYSISPQTEYPDVAAAFLDYLSSPEAAQIQVETGFMPVDTEADIATEGLLGDIAEAFAPVAENNNIVPFPGHAAPGMTNQFTSGVQGIIAGQTTTDEYLASLQQAWTEYHG